MTLPWTFIVEWSYEARYALEISVSSAYFYAVILSQMANLLTCKTRKASLFEQGLMNCKLNAALVACLAVGGFIATGDLSRHLLKRPVSARRHSMDAIV